ncbi:MAG: YihY/virulence factor BrkB family protein [Candidatus Aminicenantes bacterium]|nr:YihY/virulence factor BrkB family protein [Candidatus Aminicenantes bacterium]
MVRTVIRVLGESFKRFNDDRCFAYSIIISYFTLLCAVPLLALFAWATSKFLGSSEIAVRSLNIFTEDFFARFDPSFFSRLGAVSKSTSSLGLFGIIGSIVAGGFLFGNLIKAVNTIFRIKTVRSFFYNRLMENIIMLITAVILLFSFSITATWTAIHKAIQTSAVVNDYLNPKVLPIIDNFLVQYLIPFMLGFLVLFVIYKFIPETKVHTLAAVVAAAIGSFLWEIFKRSFFFYVAHFSAVGLVMSKFLAGTLTSIIFFLLWISSSLAILLWGAELAAVFNERVDAKRKGSGLKI